MFLSWRSVRSVLNSANLCSVQRHIAVARINGDHNRKFASRLRIPGLCEGLFNPKFANVAKVEAANFL